MKKKKGKRINDHEINALRACYSVLSKLSFDAQWRVINYLCVRLWNREDGL